jgi:CBS domain containing-hemolysin-like protein
MGLLIFFVLLAIISSFIASILEGTLLSTSVSFIQDQINKGKKSGELLSKYKNNIAQPLAAILSFDTISSVVGATGAGIKADHLFNNLEIDIFVVLFTLSSLILAEIIPKTLSAVYWKRTASFTAYTLSVLIVIMYPITAILNLITRLLTPRGNISPIISREEMLAMAQISEDIGTISKWEEEIIKNLLKLQQIKVQKILTPRIVVVAFPENMTIKEVLEKEEFFLFTRIPIYKDNIDEISGYVLRYEVMNESFKNTDATLESLKRTIYAIPSTTSVTQVVEKFTEKKEHIFLVIDEYGGTLGIVTLEDAIETLLGFEIVDEKDKIANMQELALMIARSKVQ